MSSSSSSAAPLLAYPVSKEEVEKCLIRIEAIMNTGLSGVTNNLIVRAGSGSSGTNTTATTLLAAVFYFFFQFLAVAVLLSRVWVPCLDSTYWPYSRDVYE